MNRDNTK